MSGVSRQECEKLRERLPEYADGSLAGPERVRIDAHLGRCPRCAAEVEDLRAMLRAVHSVTPDEVPDDLLRRVREAVRARPPAPAGLPRLLPRIAVPVALAVGIVAIGFALRAPRERARMAALPQGAMAQEERLALSAGAGRAGARGGGARGGGARGGGARGGGARGGGGGAGRAAGGRVARGPVVVAEATEESRLDRLRRPDGANIGLEKPAESKDRADERAAEPKETDAFYADSDLPKATAAQPAPGPGGPAGPSGTPENGSSLKLEHEGTAGEGMGGIAGGGALFRGAGRRDGTRPGAPLADKRSDRSSWHYKGTAREGDVSGSPLRQTMPADDGLQAGAAADDMEDAPTPPLSATLGFDQYETRPALALQFASDEPVAEMSVYLGDPADRRLVWQGSSPSTVPLVLTPEHIGPAPAATPITIEAGEESRHYLLFTPTLARLGEVAQTAPTGAYAGESISQALAELTALTGLVVLAEEPLCQVLSGDKPGGAPDAALRELAARAGLEVERAGDVVFNLKHPR